jgi:hypothetical protein
VKVTRQQFPNLAAAADFARGSQADSREIPADAARLPAFERALSHLGGPRSPAFIDFSRGRGRAGIVADVVDRLALGPLAGLTRADFEGCAAALDQAR